MLHAHVPGSFPSPASARASSPARVSSRTPLAARGGRRLLRAGGAVLLAVIGGLALAGCGETPDQGASRDAAPTSEGGSRSTLGRARDRAVSVIDDMKEADQERMDLINEMNGVEPEPEPEPPAGGNDDDRDR